MAVEAVPLYMNFAISLPESVAAVVTTKPSEPAAVFVLEILATKLDGLFEAYSLYGDGLAVPMPTLPVASTTMASVPAAETWKGLSVEPDAVVILTR